MSLKKMLLCAAAALGLCVNASAQIKCEVNECFELTSIVFRLAGAEEYVINDLEKYTSAVDKYFERYKKHPLIDYCQQLRSKQAIGYDAVAGAGSFIDIVKGKVISNSGGDRQISKLDPRWTEESFKKFVELLNDFYKKSKFRKFFDQQAEIRQLAERRYDSVLMRADPAWFHAFFGGEPVKLHSVISLCNGRNNYGFRDKDGSTGSVVGTGSDQNGDPYYSDYMLLIFVHEVLHGYVNSMVIDNWAQMQVAADEMFPYVAPQMQQIAYGTSQATVVEWMVRLFTLCYAKDHPEIFKQYSLEDLIFDEQQQGFVWMDRSVAFINKYTSARDKYKTVAQFMPCLVEHVNQTCKDYQIIAEHYRKSGPAVVSVSPGPGEKIFKTIDKVVFTFSEPMQAKHSFRKSNKISAGDSYWQDSITFVVPVNCMEVEDEEVVGIVLMTNAFVSEKGARSRQSFPYYFTIDKE